MEEKQFLKRVLELWAGFLPFCGSLSTVYGIYVAFRLIDDLEPSHAVAPGILSALLCTVILMALSFLIVALYPLLRGGTT
jgi:biopolymer transport protein ExbB/TolQ